MEGWKRSYGPWAEEEIQAFVEFILLYEKDDKWPCHKRSSYWKGAGKFIPVWCKTEHLCSGVVATYASL